MYHLLAITSWLWDRVTGDDEDAEGESSNSRAFSLLDASVHYAHGDARGEGVRALQRANEHANELEDAQREQR